MLQSFFFYSPLGNNIQIFSIFGKHFCRGIQPIAHNRAHFLVYVAKDTFTLPGIGKS